MGRPPNPLGRTVEAGAARRAARSAAYRRERDRTARAAAVAKLVIQRRTELGLTQKELARRAGTSYSQVSRIESGRHSVTNETFDKVFVALGATPIHGYEVPARPGHPARRELVAV